MSIEIIQSLWLRIWYSHQNNVWKMHTTGNGTFLMENVVLMYSVDEPFNNID